MTEHQFFSPKVQQLVTLVQKSPLFGEAYDTVTPAVLEAKMQTLYQEFTPLLRDTLSCGMPDADDEVVDDLVKMIAPKVVVFCAMMAVEETDLQILSASTLGFALMYWADHQIDQGDIAMDIALQAWLSKTESLSTPSRAMARLSVLQIIDSLLEQISLLDDRPWLRDQPFAQFFYHAKSFQNLCTMHRRLESTRFWMQYTDDVVRHMVGSIQLPGTIAMLYALYRRRNPSLPSLTNLFVEPHLMPVLARLGNVSLRVFDDAGDQDKDIASGTLNLFANPHPAMLSRLWTMADITTTTYNQLLSLSQSNIATTVVVDQVVKLLRTRVIQASEQLSSDYSWFLILAKRFLACGYVNAIGDQHLREDTIE